MRQILPTKLIVYLFFALVDVFKGKYGLFVVRRPSNVKTGKS